MIVRFDTWEQACLFAAEMRSEGRHAVVLDEGVCFLWGPLAVGGLRVAVSDIVLDEDGEWPETETRESELANVLRGLITAFAASGPVLLLANLGIEKAHDPDRHPGDSVEVLVSVILVAGALGAFAVMGPLMPAFTRFLRDDGLFASRLLRLLIGLFCLVSLL